MKEMPLYHEYFDPQLYGKQYSTFHELLIDYFCILDAYLHLAVVIKEQKDKQRVMPMHGVPVQAQDVHLALYGNSLTSRQMQLSDEVKKDVIQMYKHLYSRSKWTEDRLFLLQKHFQLTHFEVFCLILALSLEYSRNYEGLFMYLQNRTNEMLPTKGLASSLFQLINDLPGKEKHQLIFNTGNLGLFFLNTQDHSYALSDGLCLSKQVIEFLLYHTEQCNLNQGEEILQGRQTDDFGKIDGDHAKQIHSSIKRLRAQGKHVVVHLQAKSLEAGKRFVLRWGNQQSNQVICYPVSMLYLLDVFEMRDRICKLKMCEYLNQATFCLIDDVHPEGETATNLSEMSSILEEQFAFFFLLTLSGTQDIWNDFKKKLSWQITEPTAKEREEVWSRISLMYPIDKAVNLTKMAGHVLGMHEEIQKVLDTAELYMQSEGKSQIGETEIMRSIKQRNPIQLGSFASILVSDFRWNDLILEKSQLDMLQLLCKQVRYRQVVGEQWGFHRKMPYGRGVHAMFYGAPGTGKTMAAGVVANELGMALYRIDLSQLMSKYIGETEKNIAALFDKAKDLNGILFFDEADGLFTKRSEVHNANDRSANAMTGYLLQKLEEYEGVSILATNILNHIDDAFKRRIKLMIHFAFPDESTRYQLFHSILPTEAKCDETLDFAFFAKHFELSGSSIKEVLVNAAYMAAGEGIGICNRHVVRAIQINYLKYGKILKAQDFGYLME